MARDGHLFFALVFNQRRWPRKGPSSLVLVIVGILVVFVGVPLWKLALAEVPIAFGLHLAGRGPRPSDLEAQGPDKLVELWVMGDEYIVAWPQQEDHDAYSTA